MGGFRPANVWWWKAKNGYGRGNGGDIEQCVKISEMEASRVSDIGHSPRIAVNTLARWRTRARASHSQRGEQGERLGSRYFELACLLRFVLV